jgi:drug/metabolite transporter (DMT)-like permease
MNYQEIKPQRHLLAVGEALLVSLIWSSTFVIVKLGLESLGPLTIAGLRYFLGSLILAPFLLLNKPSGEPISGNLWLRLILIGISSYTIGNGALFWGLKYIPATMGSFLMSLTPLLVLAGGALWLKEVPTRRQSLGVVLSLLGSGLFFSAGLLPGEPIGLGIFFVGSLGFVSFSLLGRSVARERSLGTMRLTTFPLLIGGAFTLILAFIMEGLPVMTTKSWLIVAWLALINTALGYVLYNHALRELTALEMNIALNLTPLFTALLSWQILGERLSPIQIAGMLIVIFGVLLVQQRNRVASKLPDTHPG